MYEDRYIGRNAFLSAPPPRISIAADGPQAEVFRTSPVEPWRIVRTRLRVGGLVPGPVEGGGRAAGYFTGATGVTIYRGDAWPAHFKGLAIIGDVGSNLVHRKRLEPSGLAFVARRMDEQSEFVSSSDIWFRPAQFANAPDGSLYVIDVCREVIEHPKSLPPEIKRHLDLTAGRDRGRIYRVVPEKFQHRKTPRFSELATSEVVEMLEHGNAWHRETAARVLFERQDLSAAEPLRTLAEDSASPQGRLHAMYALAGMGQLDEALILARLDDEHPQVRRHAIRLAERVPASQHLCDQLASLADDDSLEVRYQLAFTVGLVDCAQRATILGRLIRRDANEVWMRAAVQSSLHEGAGALFADLVNDSQFRSTAAGDFLARLASQIAQQNQAADMQLALDAIPRLPAADAAFALPVIGELLAHRRRAGGVLAEPARANQLKAIDAVVEKMILASIETAMNPSADETRRVAAIDALSFASLDDVETVLTSLVDNRQPQQVQRAAITTLGKFSSPRVAPPLVDAWRGLSPQLRETAVEVLFARPERIRTLFDAVDEGEIAVAALPKARLQVAAKSKDQSVKDRAEQYLQSAGSQQRQEIVEAYRSALEMDGDIERGRLHFRKHCAVCHKVEGFGHEIGPNLATIKSRGAETILVNVLDPNREVNPQYLNYVVLTEDGRAMTGMIAAESATSLTLRRAESATDTVLRIDIDQLQSTGLSIMPEGMEESVDKQAMADIIAYLMQVK